MKPQSGQGPRYHNPRLSEDVGTVDYVNILRGGYCEASGSPDPLK